jgi:hypothetical protein
MKKTAIILTALLSKKYLNIRLTPYLLLIARKATMATSTIMRAATATTVSVGIPPGAGCVAVTVPIVTCVCVIITVVPPTTWVTSLTWVTGTV